MLIAVQPGAAAQWGQVATAGASLVASVGVVVLYFVFRREMAFFSRRLTAVMCASNCGLAAMLLWAGTTTVPSTGITCFVQGLVGQMCLMASCLCTTCFAVHLYYLVKHGQQQPTRFQAAYYGTAVLLPLLAGSYICVHRFSEGWLPTTAAYDPYGHQCWVMEGSLEQSLLIYAPILGSALVNLVIYARLWSFVAGSAIQSSIRCRVWLYTMVFVVCVGPSLANRVASLVGVDVWPSAIMQIVEAWCAGLWGFLSAAVYATDPQMRQRCAACCKRRKVAPEPVALQEVAYSPIKRWLNSPGSTRRWSGDSDALNVLLIRSLAEKEASRRAGYASPSPSASVPASYEAPPFLLSAPSLSVLSNVSPQGGAA